MRVVIVAMKISHVLPRTQAIRTHGAYEEDKKMIETKLGIDKNAFHFAMLIFNCSNLIAP